jgi:hypothetical protein
MKVRGAVYAAATATIFLSGALSTSQATPITVTNFSFEDPQTTFFLGGAPSGWTFSGGSVGIIRPIGAFNGGAGNFMDPSQFPGQGAPNQNQVAYILTGTLSQDTGTAAVAGQEYTLDLWAGHQNNSGSSTAIVVNLLEGSTTFATFSGDVPVDTYMPVSITGTAAGLGNLTIELQSPSGQNLFDDIRLTAVPEPAGVALFGLGGVLLLRRVLRIRR